MKRLIAALMVAVLGALSASAGAAGSAELDMFRKAIRAQYDLKEKGFADDDPAVIVEQFYSEDVFSVGPDGIGHSGREELRKVYNEVVPTSTVRVESFRSAVDGNSGWDWANFYVTPDDAAEKPFSFVILFLWEKRGGKWWCVGDIYVLGKYPPDSTAEAAH